jgi:hypothetical protein
MQETIILQRLTDDTPQPEPGRHYWVRRLGESRLQVARWTSFDRWIVGQEPLTHDHLAAISLDPIDG